MTPRGGITGVTVLEVAPTDWGNPVHRAFADAVVDWEPRVLASNADGFFKIALRKHYSADWWSWAMEWNHAMRIIESCGKQEAAQEVAAGFPTLKPEPVAYGSSTSLAYRIEIPLGDDEDDRSLPMGRWHGPSAQRRYIKEQIKGYAPGKDHDRVPNWRQWSTAVK